MARAEAVVAVTGESGVNSSGELSVVLHPRPDNTSVTSDLATIVESLTLNTDCSGNTNSNRTSNSIKPILSSVHGNKVRVIMLIRYYYFTFKISIFI